MKGFKRLMDVHYISQYFPYLPALLLIQMPVVQEVLYIMGTQFWYVIYVSMSAIFIYQFQLYETGPNIKLYVLYYIGVGTADLLLHISKVIKW